MRNVVLFGGLLTSVLLASGCSTPGYSPAERNQQISRNQDYEAKQAVDDFDHLFLLRPAGHMTPWNVR